MEVQTFSKRINKTKGIYCSGKFASNNVSTTRMKAIVVSYRTHDLILNSEVLQSF
jgi:hypothetical protein